jgi:NADH-quinone oxidoreductase B subunit
MVGKSLFRLKDRLLKYAALRSPWVLHMDTGGCNGCSIELFAVLNPRFDIERFGGQSRANPRHTDVLLIDGAVTRKIEPVLKRIYEQTPGPKAVIAVGACAISKGIFHDAYNIAGPLDRVMPVDVYVPGCPPRPDAILQGVVKALEIWRNRL